MLEFPEIQSIICIGEGLLPETLQSKTRKREVVLARQLVMYFLVQYTKESWAQIGAHYGKEHATAMHAYKTINNLKNTYKYFSVKISLYEFKFDAQIKFEYNIVIDKICEIKELLKVKIDGGYPISYDTIIVYNKLMELEQQKKPNIVEKPNLV